MPYYMTLLKDTDEGIRKLEETVTVPTLSEAQALAEDWLGFIPDWLLNVSKDTYLQEEDEQGDLILDIEGAEVD